MTADKFALDFGDLLKKPSELSEPELFAFYGKAGSGKTYLAASICEVEGFNKVLIIDTEGSTSGAVSRFPDDRIDIIPATNLATINKVIATLCAPGATHGYDAVILDTLDVAQEYKIEHALANTKNEKGVLDTRAGWGEVRKWTIKIARMLKAAPFLSIMVAHEEVDKTESGAIISTLMMAGGAKSIVPGIPDAVGYTSRGVKDGKEETTVFFAANPKRSTKNRFYLPHKIEAPDMNKIYNEIRNTDPKEKI